MKRIITMLLAGITVSAAAQQHVQTISIDAGKTGKTFEGIGAVNGGGATSVLLKDYPEKQRAEILDMVYKPMFGASLSTLLVEIPGDGNSTQGSMPSHSHYRGDHNYRRGYTWWVMKEAKKRNPQLSLDATAWSVPGWVGKGNFWSQDAADYYVSWLRGLRDIHGLELDAIGCRNEKGVSHEFAKTLRRTLNDGGGTVVTMTNPQTGDYSIIIETKDARTTQTLKAKTAKGLSKGKLNLWRSTEQKQFERLDDITPRGGSFTLVLEPNTVYSLSTMPGQRKGSFAGIPASKPFPLPYKDDFNGYDSPAEWGYLPHYTADIIGTFELTERPDNKGQCIRQTVGEHTQSWAPEWHYYTIIGDSAWSDYEVSADVYLNPQDEAALMGRVCHVGTGYGIIAKGYYMKLDDKGRCSLVITRGKENKKEKVGDAEQQALIAAMDDKTEGGEKILATADLTNGGVHASFALQWHSLKLRFDGDVITGYVDGREVVKATSAQYPRGMAGLMAPMQEQRISTPYFDNLEIVPVGRSAATPAMPLPDIKPLYK